MRSRTAARELAVALLFIILAIAMTWPLAPNIKQAVFDPSDPFYTTWTLDWDYYATVHHLPLFQANAFYPAKYALAFSEHLYGIAMFLFPLFAAGLAPLTIHNIALLLGFAGCGYAMYALARQTTGSVAAGIIGGIAYAFVGIRFHHLPHIQYVWSMWLPLMLLAFLAFIEKPDWLRAGALAATTTLNGLTTLHWLAFGSVALVITAIALAFVTGRAREKRFWLLLIAAGIVTLGLLLPFLIPYHAVARLYGMHRNYADALPNSSSAWTDWLQPNYQNKLYGRFSPGAAYGHERTLLAGIGVYLLALFGLASKRTPAYIGAILWIVVGAFGARGLYGTFGRFLFDYVPGFNGIRMPVRWAMVSFVGIALFASFGMARLLRDRPNRSQIALTCVIAAALLLEMRVAPLRWYLVSTEPRPVYDWLKTRQGAILELPMKQDYAYEYLWRSTVHHHPLINGVSSYLPRDYGANLDLGYLERIGCRQIVVHEALLHEQSAEIRKWLREGIDAHRLAFVKRFEAGRHGDYVFAVTHETGPLAAEAETFLNGGVNRFDNTCGRVDIGPATVQRGELTIIGWATSAAGIDHVNLRFANGRNVIRADPEQRDDMRSALPWHPPVYGFRKTLAPLIEGDTDMQVEIVDKAGQRVRMSPFWFRWEPHLVTGITWREEHLDGLLRRLGQDPASVRPRIVSGQASIVDYTPSLLSDPYDETDSAFANRIVQTILNRPPDSAAISPYLRMLENGVIRERVIDAVVKSKEFAAEYYVTSPNA